MTWEPRGPSYLTIEALLVQMKAGTIIDVETTGLDPASSGIVCFGSVQGSTLEMRARSRKMGPNNS